MENDSPQIKAIRARYKTSLNEKAELIERYIAELSEDSSKNIPENITIFRSELHKLAGSSGMYGYQDVCDLCRQAMDRIDTQNLAELPSITSQLHELLLSYSKS